MNTFSTYENTHKHSVVACSISPCGEYLAFNSDPVTLKIVSLKLIRFEPLNNNITKMNDVLPSLWEKTLSSQIRCLDFGHGNVNQNRLPHRSNKRRITYFDIYNACILAVGLKSGEIKVYSLIPSTMFDGYQSIVEYGGNPRIILHDHYEDITTVSFSFDGSLRLASASIDGKMRLWDMWDDGNMYQLIKIPSFKPSCCAWGNESKHVCIVGAMGKGFVYQSEKPCAQIASLSGGHSNDISACRYSSDNSMLSTCSFDTSLLIWCAVTYKPLLQIWQTGVKPSKIIMGGQHLLNIRDVQISPDCLHLISVTDDNFIRQWNLEESENPVGKISIHSDVKKFFMNFLRFFPDGRKYLIGTNDGKLIFFDGCLGPATLATLCRKSIRKILCYHLYSVHSPNVKNQEISLMDILKDQKSLLELHSFFPDDRRHSTSQLYNFKILQNRTTLATLVERLPIPRMLKSYLLYGLHGGNVIQNSEPRPLVSHFRGRNMSVY